MPVLVLAYELLSEKPEIVFPRLLRFLSVDATANLTSGVYKRAAPAPYDTIIKNWDQVKQTLQQLNASAYLGGRMLDGVPTEERQIIQLGSDPVNSQTPPDGRTHGQENEGRSTRPRRLADVRHVGPDGTRMQSPGLSSMAVTMAGRRPLEVKVTKKGLQTDDGN